MCFNFQISRLLLSLLSPSSNGWFVGGLVGGWATESKSVLELHLYEPWFLAVPHRCASFHRCLLFPSFVCACSYVHECAILIRVLSISHICVKDSKCPATKSHWNILGVS